VSETGNRMTVQSRHALKQYSEYKPTGLATYDRVPAHWQMVRLKYVARINMGQSPDSGDCNLDGDGLPFLQGNGEFGSTHPAPNMFCTNLRKLARAGDLLLSVRAPVGQLNEADQDYGIGRGLCAIAPKQAAIRKRFLWHLLHVACPELHRVAVGSTYDAVSVEQISGLPCLIPPDREQERITSFLDRVTGKIDALMAKKERLIALLEEKRVALINRGVTCGLNPTVPMKDSGISWLGQIPAHWAVAPVYSRYEVQLGKMLDTAKITGQHLAPYLRNVDVQWDRVNVEDLPEMDFSESDRKRCLLRLGDLLVCEGGEVGRAAVWKGDLPECYYQKAIHRLRPYKGCDEPRFMFYVLYNAAQLGVFVAEGNPNTIDHLTAEKLRAHRFAFPPVPEQQAIVSHLDRRSQA